MALTNLAACKLYLGLTGVTKDALINSLIPQVSDMIETYCQRHFNLTTYKDWVYPIGGKYLYLPEYPITELKRVVEEKELVFKITNTSTDAVSATAQITLTEMHLNIYGGANAGSDALTLSAYATLTLFQAAVTALAKNWTMTISSGCAAYPVSELLTGGGNALSSYSVGGYIPRPPYVDVEIDRDSGQVRALETFPRNRLWVEYIAGYTTIPADLELICIKMIADLVNLSGKDTSVKSEKWPHYSYILNDTLLMNGVLEQYRNDLSAWKRVII